MPKEFIMRGKTPSGTQEVLNFGGRGRPGYGYRMTEMQIWPSTDIGAVSAELSVTVTADNSAEDPQNPNFNNEGLIATAMYRASSSSSYQLSAIDSIVNDLFVITQDLIIKTIDTVSGAPMDVNWQCRFKEVKLSTGAEAVANYKQFAIFDD